MRSKGFDKAKKKEEGYTPKKEYLIVSLLNFTQKNTEDKVNNCLNS